ncbi:MAG: permease-like cell division protein FtsX [Burkholderiales bacterium]|nr:permease-like cell division protein FtsX [Burkholderiales bacterium]
MIGWARHHVQSCAAALRRLARAPLAVGFNVLTVGIALALPLGGYLALENLARLAAGAGAKPQLSVYFARDTGPPDVDRVRAGLEAAAGVRAVRFIGRDEALRKMQQDAGLAEILAALKSNPLPDVLVIDLAAEDPAAAEALATRIQALPEVERVQFDAQWARRLDAALRVGRLALTLLAGLLAIGLVTVSFNAVRLQIVTQRDEIELAKLVGATDAFVRRPFLYQGAAIGVLGGIAAAAIVLGAWLLLERELARLAAAYGTSFRLHGLPPSEWAAILAFSGIIGWSGAYASASKYLHAIRPR